MGRASETVPVGGREGRSGEMTCLHAGLGSAGKMLIPSESVGNRGGLLVLLLAQISLLPFTRVSERSHDQQARQ